MPINREAEKYLDLLLQKKVPYEVSIANATIHLDNSEVYAPGKLTQFFTNYLLENDLVKNKIILDAGAGCFALGIVSAKNGAAKVLGTDLSDQAIACAKKNIALNQVGDQAEIMQGNGLSFLLAKYAGNFDLILASPPWDTITTTDFAGIPLRKKKSQPRFLRYRRCLYFRSIHSWPKSFI